MVFFLKNQKKKYRGDQEKYDYGNTKRERQQKGGGEKLVSTGTHRNLQIWAKQHPRGGTR